MLTFIMSHWNSLIREKDLKDIIRERFGNPELADRFRFYELREMDLNSLDALWYNYTSDDSALQKFVVFFLLLQDDTGCQRSTARDCLIH